MRRGASSAPWLAALAGIALAGSFPPLGFAPLGWVALWPLLVEVRARPAAARFALGAITGLVWGGFTVAPWLYPAIRSHLAAGTLTASLLTTGAVWTYGGVYLAVFALVYSWLPRPRWLAAPAAWVFLETIRTHVLGGAPWALLGHSQHALLALAQIAELGGVGSLSFLVLMPAAALAASGRERIIGLAATLVATLAAATFGASRLAAPTPAAAGDSVAVRVVSGHNLDADSLRGYFQATTAGPPATLLIWPENAVAGYLEDDPVARATVVRAARDRGWLLLGAPRYEGRGATRRYFNSALLFDPEGERRGVYDKPWLVPLAERSPLSFLRTVERPFTPGAPQPAPLVAGRLRLGPLVCWDAVFPEPALSYARAGVDLLVNLTSDQDLGRGALQLLAFSRFRAIETRRWLVRASGTGASYLIDPLGHVHQGDTLGLVPGSGPPPTFYVRHAGIVAWAPAVLLALLVGIGRRERTVVPHRERGSAVGSS